MRIRSAGTGLAWLVCATVLAAQLGGCTGMKISLSSPPPASPPPASPAPAAEPTAAPPAARPAAPAPIEPVEGHPLDAPDAQGPARAAPDAQAGASASRAPQPEAAPETATVGAGDTLYSVARRHRVAIRDLIEINGLAAPYDLAPGRVLRLPPPHEHLVAQGETLYGVSRRYGVDMTSLARLNELQPPYRVRAGQVLRIPERMAAAIAAPAPSAAPDKVPLGPRSSAGAVVATRPSEPEPARSEAAAKTALPPKGRAEPTVEGPRTDTATAAALAPPPVAAFLWPVKGKILSAFGPKPGGEHNDGINIEAPRGAPVRAAGDGVVAYAGNELRGFGNLILIKHADGWTTAYAHNDALLVGRGETVRRGQIIARAGSTGTVASPQVHFEIRRGTQAVNPAEHLSALGDAPLNRVADRDVRQGPE